MTATTRPVLDIAGIARVAGAPYETAMTWRRRSLAAERFRAKHADWKPRSEPLPLPDYLDDPPRWYEATIQDWLRRTGRRMAPPRSAAERSR